MNAYRRQSRLVVRKPSQLIPENTVAGNALTIVETYLKPEQQTMPLIYPVTTEKLPDHLNYETLVSDFYDQSAEQVAAHLDAGRDVAVICEGDPFFYGSFMHLYARLQGRTGIEVIPGIPGMVGCWNATGLPMTWGDDVLSVLPGTMEGLVLPTLPPGALPP